MTGITALTILLCIYAAGELIALKTEAVFSTVLSIALLLLAGFWSGILPRTVIDDAQVNGFGNLVAGILIVSLGTTIDFPELKRQWKVVVTSTCCVVGAVAAIILFGSPIMGADLATAGAPIFAGGSAATLIMTTALSEKGLELAQTFCIVLYVTQKFIGVPIASILLRRTAKKFRDVPELVEMYSIENHTSQSSKKRLPLQMPASFHKPSIYLAKLGLVAMAANYASKLTGGRLHYFVMCLLMGMLFFALGFLEKNILAKTQSSALITFFVTILIFSNLAQTTPEQVLSVLLPLVLAALLGTFGTVLIGFICSRLLRFPFGLAVSLGISCTFGFPTTMLIPQEVAEALGRNEKEKTAILNYLLPKMLIAGFVTVTIASVLIAGVVVNML